MHKWAMFILFVAASVLGLSVIIFAPPSSGEVIPEAEENEVLMIMTNFQFDQPEYRITAGETVKLTLVNRQGTHGVLVEGTDIDLTPENLSQEVTFDEPGEYTLYCSIMCGAGHSDMISKLIVEAPSDDVADEEAAAA